MVATIKDVAKRANLSPATVSRALNKSGYVSEKTLDRVTRAVAELGYQLNWMARGCTAKRPISLGCLCRRY